MATFHDVLLQCFGTGLLFPLSPLSPSSHPALLLLLARDVIVAPPLTL